MTTLQQCQRVPADDEGCSDCHGRFPLLAHSLCSLGEDHYGIMPQDLIDEQHLQQGEEQFANTLCDHFAVFQHLKPWEWSPLAYLAKLGFVHGIKLCIARGWDDNEMHVDDEQCVPTSLSHVMRASLSRRLGAATVLLEHGGTDVIDVFRPCGDVIKYSPALQRLLSESRELYKANLARDLYEPAIRLLLDHGSLVNCPYYAGGTLLAPSIFGACEHLELEWVPQLLIEYGGCLDVVFQDLMDASTPWC
ncbi:hypothetical protein M422DRAFT_254273 [Sphaerobolus stellatus SS14]|uniref:Uncharacterized protein n=1 Tax=Sphaerobolus stellatus (strain SS14) TaxID=990650 RepID=A0A0C9V6B8_SPHS4|nr:hypothetical protein M422DRAFT_254273 [Sphaerobolus stellatus SS14]